MIIGVDASRANRLQKTGVEWYGYHVIQHLKRLPEAADHSWLLYTRDPLMHGLEIGPPEWHETILSWPPKYLWTQARLSLEMAQHSPDVLYVSSHVLPRVVPNKSVVVVHDIGFHRLPHLYPARQRWYHEWSTKDILNRASRVLTVSEFTKQELIDAYGAPAERLHVAYPGIDHQLYHRQDVNNIRKVLERLQISHPFFLYIGRVEPKKNVEVVVHAFEQFMVQAFETFKERRGLGDPFTLVLVGPDGVDAAPIERLIAQSPIAPHVRRLHYVSENDKISLLSAASALIHPAWYEGFGIPIIEAMSCGCPVVCARTSALPEVAGSHHVAWFDPNNVYDLVSQMNVILHPDTEQTRHVESARAWAERYTWERTARRTLQALTDWS